MTPEIQKLIEKARAEKSKTLNLNGKNLKSIPEQVYELEDLEELYLNANQIQIIPPEIYRLKNLKKLFVLGNPIETISEVNGLYLDYSQYLQLESQISMDNVHGLYILKDVYSEQIINGLDKFKNLTSLDLGGNQLKEVPESITKLVNLTSLSLGGNQLKEIPESITKLVNLTSLDLGFNQLKEIPESITKLVNLTDLNLNNNQLKEIPENISKLMNLTNLELSNNQLKEIPESITKLVNLTSLDLGFNQLKEIPESIFKLVNLSSLSLNSNQLKEIPESITKLVNLTSLSLGWNQLKELPEGITKLVNLTELYLWNNQIKEIPDGISKLVNLTYLNLGSNQLKEMPDGISKLVNLTSLSLGGNQLNEIPDGITKLLNLTSLGLSSNQLNEIPESITKLVNLTNLSLGGNQLKEIPESITKLLNLTMLDLSSNQLKEIPESISKLVNLTMLALSSNQLKEIPESITKLVNLTELNLSNNQLKEVPESITKLLNLTFLSLGGNQLKEIPESITKLVNLTSLNLNNNQLKEIPESISKLVNLTSLYLGNNQLKEIPDGITKLVNLTSLFLGGNQLKEIPDSITKLLNLTMLDLSSNQLKEIPDGISKLVNLTELNLFDNQLKEIPDGITKLVNLIELNLGSNQIKEIPESISKLVNLTSLDLGKNQLKEIPESITKLVNLTKLNLRNNQLKEIPKFILLLQNLKRLSLRNNQLLFISEFLLDMNLPILIKDNYSNGIILEGNPLVNPPPFLINRGREALVDYFQRMKSGSVFYLNEIKVILVGESEAGKTSVLKQICGEPFDKSESQTHGINIRHLEVPTLDKNLKLHIWDFGGQEIMHATHQFFLTKNSIYVLVLNSRKEEGTEYWLKYIETFGGDSPILVVMNKYDEHRHEVDARTLREKHKGIRSFYKVSCKTGEGIENFKSELFQWILESNFMQVTWFQEWLSVRDELNQTNDDYINDKEYRKLCERFTITEESEQTTLLNYMHDLGTFIHFDKIALNDMYVLNPNWVTNAVYSIINSKLLANSHGKLNPNKDLISILDRKKYPTNTYMYIIEIMKEFELCFTIDTEPDSILIPSLLDPNRPEYSFDSKYSLKFEFQYTFLPLSLFSRFMVRMNKDIHIKWRAGVLLKNSEFQTEALVISDKEDQTITIKVNGDRRREYFAILLNHFSDIHKSFPPSFEVKQFIPVPGHDEIKLNYMELIKKEAIGKFDHFVYQLDKDFEIQELLNGIEDPNTRREKNKELYKNSPTYIVQGDYIAGDKEMGDSYKIKNEKGGVIGGVNVGRGNQEIHGDVQIKVGSNMKPELQAILQSLNELKTAFQQINIPQNQMNKVDNALNELEADTKSETPDTDSIEDNFEKINKIIEKSELTTEQTSGLIEKMGNLATKIGVAFPTLVNLASGLGG